VSFDRCRVEREHHGILARFSQGFKDCAPSAALGPAIEAIVDRGVRAVFARTIAPSGAGLQHVNDAAEDAADRRPDQAPSVQSAGAVQSVPTAYHSTKTSRHASLAPESKYANERITWR
jgi:hypothetical protein